MAKPKAKKKRKKQERAKLRPRSTPDGRLSTGFYSLSKILSADLDGRLAIEKARKRLEADLVDHAGGPGDQLTPSILTLIKSIVHKSLVCRQSEKMALLGQVELDKTYLAMSNSLRLDVLAFENLLARGRGVGGHDLGDYLTSGRELKKL